MHPEANRENKLENKLSAVAISRNQEWNIARLIGSMLGGTPTAPFDEIVLADSASDDATGDVARRYPITILRLRNDQKLTRAAGRYIGAHNTRGKYVLFLDGDMELYPGWIQRGLTTRDQNPDVAAVTGNQIELPKHATEDDKPPLDTSVEADVIEVSRVGGSTLYRRAALTLQPSL